MSDNGWCSLVGEDANTSKGGRVVLDGPTNVTGGRKRRSFLGALILKFTDSNVSSAVF